jgi:hypothetical protein
MHPFQFQPAGKLLVRSYTEANICVGLVDRYDPKMMGKPCFILHLDKEEIGSDQRCRAFACRQSQGKLNSEFSETGKADQIPRHSFGALAHRSSSSSKYSSSEIMTQGVSDFGGLNSTQKESLKQNSIIISYE